jgi:hypothetical protein
LATVFGELRFLQHGSDAEHDELQHVDEGGHERGAAGEAEEGGHEGSFPLHPFGGDSGKLCLDLPGRFGKSSERASAHGVS